MNSKRIAKRREWASWRPKNTASLVIFILFIYIFHFISIEYYYVFLHFNLTSLILFSITSIIKLILHWAILASLVELSADPLFSAKKWKRVHFNIGGNLNNFTTLKYKKIDQKLKFTNNTFLHTGVDHSCRMGMGQEL